MNNSYQDTSAEKILSSRERRTYILQNQLDEKNIVITFALNIPGLNKRGNDKHEFVKKHYYDFMHFISSKFDIKDSLFVEDRAGYIYFITLNYVNPIDVKEQSMKYENKIGTASALLDIDVYEKYDSKVSRLELDGAPRKCFLCDNEAKICARNQTHSYEELEKKVQELLVIPNSFTLSSDYIYADIINKLGQGSFQKNDRLVEEKLSEQYQVSRTVIRAALSELHSTGVVTYKKNVGVVVKKFSRQEIDELTDIRNYFERTIYTDIFNSMNDITYKIISSLYDSMQEINLDNEDDVLFWNKKFNNMLMGVSHKLTTKKLFRRTSDMIAMIRYQINISGDRKIGAFQEHMKILKTFLARDYDGMMKELNHHLSNAKQNALALYE